MDTVTDIDENLTKIRTDYCAAFDTATNGQELRAAKAGVLGKDGSLTKILMQLGKAAPADRKRIGEQLNSLKNEIEAKFNERESDLGDNMPTRSTQTI